MESYEIITSDKPIRVHSSWVCGDGCCSDSVTVEVPAGTYTAVEFCDQLDMVDHVNSGHYWDNLRHANYQDKQLYDYEYENDQREKDESY